MKRSFSIILGLALVAGLFGAQPAGAQTAVPAEPNIVDPSGDANYINEGFLIAGQGGDHVTPADASSIGDILAVWFSHTADTISWHVQTEAPQPSSGAAYWIEVNTNPDAEGTYCLSWDMLMAAPTYQAESFARIRDECAGTDSVPGEVVSEELPDGTGVVTGTVPRSAHANLADGGTLTAPRAFMRHATGPTPQGTLIQPTIDTTKPGTDYAISGGGTVVEPEPEPEPPGKSDPPGKGKKKGCKKGKGKKKGACPGKKQGKPEEPTAPSCPAYVPGEEGAEAELSVVTDEHTAEAPLTVELDAAAGLANDLGLGEFATGSPVYDETSSVYQNLQVDTKSATSGLYVRVDFAEFHDYDLYLNRADGSTAANSGDFNAGAGHDIGGGSPDGGWEAGTSYESVKGIRVADCEGFSSRIVSYLTNGGTVTLTAWLGEATVDQVPPPEEGGEALGVFYSLLRI